MAQVLNTPVLSIKGMWSPSLCLLCPSLATPMIPSFYFRGSHVMLVADAVDVSIIISASLVFKQQHLLLTAIKVFTVQRCH
eukprot:6195648-Pleurochrysis_carterae.AAC.4